MRRAPRKPAQRRQTRCAIYTRKSTDEGLDSDFNSLDAQRESAEAFIQSQRGAGWVGLRDRYEDGGYSGASMDRPALQRLLQAVERGEVDAIVVYRLDRLTRFLPDFARMTELLERHGCALVSVTEQFSTTTPSGRLHLNMLMTFAQHEREVIAQRTKDKMGAARRKGKWTGGPPVLGYDRDEGGGRIVVNESEAGLVREIFDLYLEHQSLATTANLLNARGRTTKRYTTKKGRMTGGQPWTKTGVSYLLTNVIYTGRVAFDGTLYEGEHEAILDPAVWERVQGLLRRNGRSGGRATRNKYGALLRGLLRCGPCDAAMVHSFTRKGQKIHRYYTCRSAQQKGWHSCPSKSLPAVEIETFVGERLHRIGTDPDLRREVLANLGPKSTADERAAIEALEAFVPIWEALGPRERARAIQLLIERVTYDGERKTLGITFRPNGIEAVTEKGAA